MSESSPQILSSGEDAEHAVRTIAKRNPWIAGLLSFLLPGLGQLYNGQAKRGALVYSLSLVVQIFSLIVLIEAQFAPFNVVLPFLVIFLARNIIPAVDAAIEANRSQGTYQAKAYNKWYVYILILIISLVIEPGAIITNASLGAVRVPTVGMENTVMGGDRLIVNKIAYYIHSPFGTGNLIKIGTPRRGEVVTFIAPDDRKLMYIKRVIGLPGDKVEIKQRKVYVNGEQLFEPYIKFDTDAPDPYSDKFGPIIVPPAHFFMLGDNRNNSADSRVWGTVPQEDIFSQAKKIYWSSDPQSGSVRWERFGQAIR